MVGRSDVKKWLKAASRGFLLLALSAILVRSVLHAGPANSVILLWDHPAGPFSYNVYEATNLDATPVQWRLLTNTADLTVRLPARAGEHYFRVSCVDTNTGLESLFADR
jgi:hypothetical protein